MSYLKKGSLIKTKNIILGINTEITKLKQNKSNKYQEINETNRINFIINKEKIRIEFYRRIKAILKKELNAKNKVKLINTLPIPTVLL